MKKFLFYGIVVQIVVLLISIISRDIEIIKNLNGLIVGGVLSLGAAMNLGGEGREHVGLQRSEKKKVFSHQATRTTKLTIFMLPAIIVLIVYVGFYGFDSLLPPAILNR